MKITDLQFHDILKDKYREEKLIDRYKCLPSANMSLKEVSLQICFSFWYDMTYLREKTFSKMKYTKSCYRS